MIEALLLTAAIGFSTEPFPQFEGHGAGQVLVWLEANGGQRSTLDSFDGQLWMDLYTGTSDVNYQSERYLFPATSTQRLLQVAPGLTEPIGFELTLDFEPIVLWAAQRVNGWLHGFVPDLDGWLYRNPFNAGWPEFLAVSGNASTNGGATSSNSFNALQLARVEIGSVY